MGYGNQLLGALKTAGVNAVGGLPGYAFSVGSSFINHALAERSAQNQFNRQVDFWQMQNEYNTPLAQRRRLEEAGLNPVAAAGGIAGNNVAGQLSSVPVNGVAQSGTLQLDALQNNMSAYAVLEQVGANTDLMRQQVELAMVEKIIKDAAAFGLELDNQQKVTLLAWLDREKEVSLQKMLAEIDKTKSDTTYTNQKTEETRINIAFTQQQIEESKTRIRDIEQTIENKKTRNEIDKLALELARKFDEKFLDLDLQAREKEVQEFLDTSEVRVSLYNAQKAFAKLAMDEAERADALNSMKNEYDRHIAQQILNSIENGYTSLDAVFLKYFAESPGNAISALSSLANFAPNIDNRSSETYHTHTHNEGDKYVNVYN